MANLQKVFHFESLIYITLLTLYRTVERAKQLEHEERAQIRANRTSLSSRQPSTDTYSPSGYTDVDSDEETLHPRVVQTVSLVDTLLEGDELDEAGLFSDEDLTYNDSDLENQRATKNHEEELLDVGKGNTDRD